MRVPVGAEAPAGAPGGEEVEAEALELVELAVLGTSGGAVPTRDSGVHPTRAKTTATHTVEPRSITRGYTSRPIRRHNEGMTLDVRAALPLRFFRLAVAVALPLTLGSCRARDTNAPVATAGTQALPVKDARISEVAYPKSARQHAALSMFLPGSANQAIVQYDIADGQAVLEGDILLGPAAQVPMRFGIPWAPMTNVHSAVMRASKNHLWPNSVIPYVIDRTVSADTRDAIQWAIAHLNTTELQIRPRGTEVDYVLFRDVDRGCASYLGHIGGQQEIEVASGCGRGSMAHEILHAAGFYHEQSRGDRDQWVSIQWDDIDPNHRSNFERRDARGQDIGAYDYASLMHYSARAFSLTGRPTIVPRDPTTNIGQREGLSTLDRAAITFVYGNGAAPPPPAPTSPRPTAPIPIPTPAVPPESPPLPPPSAPQGTGFAGNYTSQRGNVACAQSGPNVSCGYQGGTMYCVASGPSQMDCAWTGGGQGRAMFQRQGSGTLAGTWGDLFSTNSRGAWDLVSAGSTPPTTPTPSPTPAPATPSPAATLTGRYASTRGPMSCTENGTNVGCTFDESGSSGRLDCHKDTTGLTLVCTWATGFPRPSAGRAQLKRRAATDRVLTGTWGYFTAAAGAGAWDMQGQ